MGKKDKLIKKFLNCPGSLKFREIECVLTWLGFERVEAKGSHVRFVHQGCSVDLSVPIHNNDCKRYYKVKISKLLKMNFYG